MSSQIRLQLRLQGILQGAPQTVVLSTGIAPGVPGRWIWHNNPTMWVRGPWTWVINPGPPPVVSIDLWHNMNTFRLARLERLRPLPWFQAGSGSSFNLNDAGRLYVGLLTGQAP